MNAKKEMSKPELHHLIKLRKETGSRNSRCDETLRNELHWDCSCRRTNDKIVKFRLENAKPIWRWDETEWNVCEIYACIYSIDACMTTMVSTTTCSIRIHERNVFFVGKCFFVNKTIKVFMIKLTFKIQLNDPIPRNLLIHHDHWLQPVHRPVILISRDIFIIQMWYTHYVSCYYQWSRYSLGRYLLFCFVKSY